jgi:hypothetical protein
MEMVLLVRHAGGADHVPYVLVRSTRDLLRRLWQHLFHELGKRARPVPGPMLLGKQAQAFEKILLLVRLLDVVLVAGIAHSSSADVGRRGTHPLAGPLFKYQRAQHRPDDEHQGAGLNLSAEIRADAWPNKKLRPEAPMPFS